MEWIDKSDSRSRLFVAEADTGVDEAGLTEMLRALLERLSGEIAGRGHAASFDTAFLEVNADTGRVLAAVSTESQRLAGNVDGCAIRSRALQDYWYDLDEAGLSDDDFSAAVSNMVSKMARIYETLLIAAGATAFPQGQTLTLIVYGSDPGVIVHRARIY